MKIDTLISGRFLDEYPKETSIFLLILLALVLIPKLLRFICRILKRLLPKKKSSNLTADLLENKIWYEKQTEFFSNLAKQLSLSLNRNKIAKYIVDNACGFLYAKRALVLLFDKESEVLKVEYAVGLEQETVKKNSLAKEEILKALSFLKEAYTLIRHHHERCDGSGYPDKIKGYSIEIGAKILAVADTFDAMVTNRPYREALPVVKAIKELKENAGSNDISNPDSLVITERLQDTFYQRRK